MLKELGARAVPIILLNFVSLFALVALLAQTSPDLLFTVVGICILNVLVLYASVLLFVKKGFLPHIQQLEDDCYRFIKAVSSDSRLSSNLNSSISLGQQLQILQEDLLETRKRERAIIDNAVDVICVIDVESRFLSVSPSAQRAWGYSNEELIAKNLTDFLASEDSSTSLEAILGAKHSIEKINFENHFRLKNGQMIDLLWSAHWSARDSGLFCVAHDITERKKVEAKLQEREMRIRTTLQAMPVGIVCTNKAGLIEFVNASMERITGSAAENLLSSSAANILADHDKEKLTGLLSSVAEGKAAMLTMEASLQKSNQDILEVEISLSTFTINSILKFLITFTDITQRKEIDRFKQEFISMINHDIRAPITSIAGSLSLIEEGAYGELSAKGKKLCNVVMLELDRLKRLANDLLELDKIESGSLVVYCDSVSAQSLIETAFGSVATYAEMRNIQVNIPQTQDKCWADSARIIQVLVNLLSNAIKFSPAQKNINIEVESSPDDVRFTITDQGRGIPADRSAVLFRRFQQLRPNDPAEREGGMGLGLSICKGIIEAHKGQIGCSSTEGAGTSFWFSLPNQPSS